MVLHSTLTEGLIAALLLTMFTAGAAEGEGFIAAQPIWPAGRSLERNLQVGFRAVVRPQDARRAELRITASTLYRATLGAQHVGYGPARGPHGYYRIDTWDLTPALREVRQRTTAPRGAGAVVAIEVAGYNANSYYTLDQPSFLQAEIVADGKVLAATGRSGFEALIPAERVQKVQRYSFQRPFSEVYRLRHDHGRWSRDPTAQFQATECEIDKRTLRYLGRGVPYPDFKMRHAIGVISRGTVVPVDAPKNLWKDRSLVAIGPKLKGYPEAELEIIPSIEMQKFAFKAAPGGTAGRPTVDAPLRLGEREYATLDFGLNNTGFIGLHVQCKEPSRLVLAFDEVLRDGDVDFKRLGCVNLVWLELPRGDYLFESFEPYTFRYLKPILLQGECDIVDMYLREYSCSGVDEAAFRASDPRLEKLFEAGRETFRQNTLDTFMDCPSRERAGWLCDSFFTARVAPDLRGDTVVERVLMENFLLAERFEFIPEGMLPMCYPADHNDGVFIPNWAMWFVVQLEEYLARSGDREIFDRLRPRVFALLEVLDKFRNDDGLLEKLPSWVFIEWSDANKYVQDVNYPSNMLYAGVLSAAGRIYRLEKRAAEAARIRETIRRQSYDGTFFVDNAIRKPDGTLEVTRNRTEVCQYFAFFFDVATTESHADLWRILRTRFGPKRREENPFPEVGMANSFIGNMLRIELLSREGLSQQILDESIDFLLYMADRTGTLWENVGDYASCNHGFASHIVHTLYRDVLGARRVDRQGRKLHLRFAPLRLDWCEGAIPTPQGIVHIGWKKKDGVLEYTCRVPPGYSVKVENLTGLPTKRLAE